MNVTEWTILILLTILGTMITYIMYKVYQIEKRRKLWTPAVGDLVHFHMENPIIGEITKIGDTHTTIQLTVKNNRVYPV